MYSSVYKKQIRKFQYYTHSCIIYYQLSPDFTFTTKYTLQFHQELPSLFIHHPINDLISQDLQR